MDEEQWRGWQTVPGETILAAVCRVYQTKAKILRACFSFCVCCAGYKTLGALRAEDVGSKKLYGWLPRGLEIIKLASFIITHHLARC